MSAINYRKFILLTMSFIMLLSFLSFSSGQPVLGSPEQPVLQEPIYIKPTIKDRSTIHLKVEMYYHSDMYYVLGVPVFEDFSIKNSELHLDPKKYPTGYATLELERSNYLWSENDSISTYAFRLVSDNELPSRLYLTLEFDITGLHSFERSMFPFDKYDSEIRLIFPISDNTVLRSYAFKCETEDKTINIPYPYTLLQRELNVKDPSEMEYRGIIYSDFFAVEKWQWVSANVKFDTGFIYNLSTFLPFDAFLILLLVMGISPILLKSSRDRIHCIIMIGTAACLVLLTGLVNYNQLLPTEVSESLGHIFIALGFFVYALSFLWCLVSAKWGIRSTLTFSVFMIGCLFFMMTIKYYHVISMDKILFHLGLVSSSFALPVLLWFYLIQLRKVTSHSQKAS